MMEMNPIKMLTDALAEMTTRAMEAEAAMEKARKDGEQWFANYKRAAEQRDKLAGQLTAEMELREDVQSSLKEEKDLHMETWGKCKELMEIAVKAGVHRESLERMIYSTDALGEIKEGGRRDAE